jgi:hypothetical protein
VILEHNASIFRLSQERDIHAGRKLTGPSVLSQQQKYSEDSTHGWFCRKTSTFARPNAKADQETM